MNIRDLDDRLKRILSVQAARNDRSMEEEAQAILVAAPSADVGSARSLYEAVRARIEPLGGIDFTIAARERI
jgi:antitoxin FitA